MEVLLFPYRNRSDWGFVMSVGVLGAENGSLVTDGFLKHELLFVGDCIDRSHIGHG